MRKPRWPILIALVLLIILAGLAVTRSTRFQKWYNPPTFDLPKNDEVTEMRASLNETDVTGTAVAEFTVPAEHVPIILDLLRPAQYINEPWRLDFVEQLGEIIIHTKSGEEVRLRFYDTGVNPVMFTRDEVDQFYGKWETYKMKAGDFEFDKGVPGGWKLFNAVKKASKNTHQ